MKNCPKCGAPVTDPCRKYCDDHCKWWFNAIKRDNERHLPPVRKRNANYFHMVTGSQLNSLRGHGRRSGGMIQGGMGARVSIMTEEIAPVNATNLKRHFFGNTFGLQSAKICDGTRLLINDAIMKYELL